MATLEQLSIQAATLSAGARLASAGGGLPARITTAVDLVVADLVYFYNNVIFDPGNAHFWAAEYNLGMLKKYTIASGAVAQTVHGSGSGIQIMGLFRFDASLFYAAVYNTKKIREYQFDGTNTKDLDVSAALGGGNPMIVVRVPGTTGKAWVVKFASGTAVEVSLTDGAATGRTVAGTIVGLYATQGVLWVLEAAALKKIQESDLAVLATWTFTNPGGGTAGGEPGYGGMATELQSVFVDAAGKPTVLFRNGVADRYTTAGGSPPVLDRRLFFGPGSYLRGFNVLLSVDNYHPAFLGFSDDGNYVGYQVLNAALDAYRAVRIRRTNWQVARFSRAFPSAATVRRVLVAGNLGNLHDGSWDARQVRAYWAIDAGARTEFTPNATLAIAVATGQTLHVDLELRDWEAPPGPAPYVEELSLAYDGGETPAPTAIATAASPAGSAAPGLELD